MDQSSSTTNNTIKEMPKTTDVLRGTNRYGVLEDSVAIQYMKNKATDILRGANRYIVLEDSDKVCTKDKVQNV